MCSKMLLASMCIMLAGCGYSAPQSNLESQEPTFQRVVLSNGNELSIANTVSLQNGRLEILYKQRGMEFCVDRGTLKFKPSLKISENLPWKGNAILSIDAEPIRFIDLQKQSNRDENSFDRKNYLTLSGSNGNLSIDIKEYLNARRNYNKNKVDVGFVSVLFFKCSDIARLDTDINTPIVPIAYGVKLE